MEGQQGDPRGSIRGCLDSVIVCCVVKIVFRIPTQDSRLRLQITDYRLVSRPGRLVLWRGSQPPVAYTCVLSTWSSNVPTTVRWLLSTCRNSFLWLIWPQDRGFYVCWDSIGESFDLAFLARTRAVGAISHEPFETIAPSLSERTSRSQTIRPSNEQASTWSSDQWMLAQSCLLSPCSVNAKGTHRRLFHNLEH
jgi:hypothetical protein